MAAATLKKIFTKMYFLLNVLIDKHYTVIENGRFKGSLFYQCAQDDKTYKKMGHFDPLRCSRKFNFSVVPVLSI